MINKNQKEKKRFRKFLADPNMSVQLERLFLSELIDFESYYFYKNVQNHGRNTTPERVYMFSNEKLDVYFRDKELSGKKVLTVGSSFDQVLNAIFKGSTDVTLIDMNMYAKFFGEFKLSAIKNLTFYEFKSLFGSYGFPVFLLMDNFKLYQKLSHNLSSEAQLFWDTIMLDGEFVSLAKLFHSPEWGTSLFYKNKQAYDKLQNILKTQDININYVMAEFSEFPKVLDKKYNLILLSNIFDYYQGNKKQKDLFFRTCKKLFKNNLENGGTIQVNSNFNKWMDQETKEDFLEDLAKNLDVGRINLTTGGLGVNNVIELQKDEQIELSQMEN